MLRDDDFDDRVTSAHLDERVFFLDTDLRGRALFERLLRHAQAIVACVDGACDDEELSSVSGALLEIARCMEAVVRTDRPRRFIDAVRHVATVFASVGHDGGGIASPERRPEPPGTQAAVAADDLESERSFFLLAPVTPSS